MKWQGFGTLGITLSLAACGSDVASERSDTDTDWQPVAGKSYPYVGEHGQTVCAEWERYEDGRHLVRAEFYHFEAMNEALLGRGPLKPDVTVALKNAGIERVVTCEHARDFMSLQQRVEESAADQAATADDAVPEAANPPENVGDAESEPPEDVIDKVGDGRSSSLGYVVRVQPWNGSTFGTCSGLLIGPRALLTAAHCFFADGVWDVRVDRGRTGTSSSVDCISGGNSCLNSPSGLNARVFRFPGFLGDLDQARDLAIVINNTNWGAGTSAPVAFLPITENRPGGGTSYWVDGYGAHSKTGSGLGIHRIANQAQGIDTSLTGYWRDEVQSGVGRPCKGDSGSPAINTDKIRGGLFGPDVAIGIFSNLNFAKQGDFCGEPGHFFRYTRIEDKLAFIDQTLVNNGLPACDRLGGGSHWAYRVCHLP